MVCGGRVERLTEGQDAAGEARWPVWGEGVGESSVGWWVRVRSARRLPATASGREWQGSQPGQGTTELGFPGPLLGQMQSEAAGLAG